MDVELRLQISEEEADAARLAEVTGYLRTELLQLHVENVATPQSGDVPAGARVVGVAAVGTLLVALGQSVDGLRSVVSAIRDWLATACSLDPERAKLLRVVRVSGRSGPSTRLRAGYSAA
jgi:hypothetical protein